MYFIEVVTFIGFCFLIPLFVVGIYLNSTFFSFLKKNYHELWKSLDSPSFFLNNSLKIQILMFKFIAKKEYLKYNNPRLIKRCNLLRFFNIAYFFVFIIWLPAYTILIIA